MIIILSGGFLLVLVGLFVVTGSFSDSSGSVDTNFDADTADITEPNTTANNTYAGITRITAKHFFDGTTHTFVGEVPLPTPCDLLETQSRVAESMPEQVTLLFTVINEAETCVQTITSQRFMIEVSAQEEAAFDAEFQGRPVVLNLLEPAPGETPDDFELYIKG